MSSEGHNRFGFGYDGFRTRIEWIAADLGGSRNVRMAVAEEFKSALSRHLDQQRHKRGGHWPDWTDATEADFDNVGWAAERLMLARPTGPVLAQAPFDAVMLELREGRVDLVGEEYHLMVALVGGSHQTYDWRKNDHIDKWQPSLLKSGSMVAHGTHYPGDARTVTTRSAESARQGMRKLVEKHFKVKFEDVKEIA